MSNLYEVIKGLSAELTAMLLNGFSANDPRVIKKSQELDKLVTAYYRNELPQLAYKKAK